MSHTVVSWRIETDPNFGQVRVHIVGTGFGTTPGAVRVNKSAANAGPKTVFAKVLSWTPTRIIIDAEAGATYSRPQVLLPDGHNALGGIEIKPEYISARTLNAAAPPWTLTHTSNDTSGITFHGTGMGNVNTVILVSDEFESNEYVGHIIHSSDEAVTVHYPEGQQRAIPKALLIASNGFIKQTVVALSHDINKNDPNWRGWISPREVQHWQYVRLPDGSIAINIYGVGFGQEAGSVLVGTENDPIGQ